MVLKTADIYNFKGGLDTRPSFNEKVNNNMYYWADAENVVLEGDIVKKTNGCTDVLNTALSTGVTILHIDSYKYNGIDYIMVITSEGKLYLYDSVRQVLTEKKSGISTNGVFHTNVWYEKFVVCNDTDDTFYYDMSTDTCTDTSLYTDKSVYGSISVSFAGRLFIASSNTLYWSALGDPTDWSTSEDAGYASTIQDTITSMVATSDYIIIFTSTASYIFTGFDYTNFQILRFGNEGVRSKHNSCVYNNTVYFYANGLRNLQVYGDLAQLRINKDLSKVLTRDLENIDSSRLNEIKIVVYEEKQQIWFFVPEKNQNDIDLCYIADLTQDGYISYTKRRGKSINSVCSANRLIYSASTTLYKEDYGNTFDGTAIEASWSSQWLTWGEGSQLKTAKSVILWHDAEKYNNYTLAIAYDNQAHTSVSYSVDVAKQFGIWDVSQWDASYWGGEGHKIKLTKGNNRRFNSMQINLSTNSATENFAIYGFSLENLRLLNAV